jgi:hypothetical protein
MVKKMYQDSQGGLNEAGRKFYKRTTGANLKIPLKSGVNPRRVSFAARFGGMKGGMKDEKGKPSRLALALRKWGFRSRESARAFANKHKKK